MAERCKYHDWESGSWGVIVGVSKCKRCGVVSRTEHFSVPNERRGAARRVPSPAEEASR